MKRKDPILWVSTLLRRYFNDQTNEAEKNIIENWNPEDIKKRFPVNSLQVEEGCRRVKDNVFRSLDIEEYASTSQGKSKRSRLAIVYKYSAIAAILLFVLGTGLYLSFVDNGEKSNSILGVADKISTYYETTFSETKKISLSDGSVIHLNGGTKLGIKESEFDKQKREIWLVDGEAFFDVAKNPEKPFIIYSKDMQVEVKGTSFNVKAYSELNEQTVSVRSGKVAVSNDRQMFGVLTANEQINYSDNHFTSRRCDYQNAMAWMDGRIVLENANADELAIRLKQKFNIRLIGYKDILRDKQLNAIFNSGTSLKEIIDNVCTLYNVKYKIKDKEVLIYQ
ncbi:MAG: FecR family protein [Dysgonomonas sp.]